MKIIQLLQQFVSILGTAGGQTVDVLHAILVKAQELWQRTRLYWIILPLVMIPCVVFALFSDLTYLFAAPFWIMIGLSVPTVFLMTVTWTVSVLGRVAKEVLERPVEAVLRNQELLGFLELVGDINFTLRGPIKILLIAQAALLGIEHHDKILVLLWVIGLLAFYRYYNTRHEEVHEGAVERNEDGFVVSRVARQRAARVSSGNDFAAVFMAVAALVALWDGYVSYEARRNCEPGGTAHDALYNSKSADNRWTVAGADSPERKLADSAGRVALGERWAPTKFVDTEIDKLKDLPDHPCAVYLASSACRSAVARYQLVISGASPNYRLVVQDLKTMQVFESAEVAHINLLEAKTHHVLMDAARTQAKWRNQECLAAHTYTPNMMFASWAEVGGLREREAARLAAKNEQDPVYRTLVAFCKEFPDECPGAVLVPNVLASLTPPPPQTWAERTFGAVTLGWLGETLKLAGWIVLGLLGILFLFWFLKTGWVWLAALGDVITTGASSKKKDDHGKKDDHPKEEKGGKKKDDHAPAPAGGH